MIAASRVSLKTMKKIGTEKRLLPMVLRQREMPSDDQGVHFKVTSFLPNPKPKMILDWLSYFCLGFPLKRGF